MLQMLLDARKRLGLTQSEMAKLLGISRNYLALIETGKRPVPPKVADQIVTMNKQFVDSPLQSGATPETYGNGKARREVDAIKRLLGVERDEDVMPKICELVQWKLSEQERIIRAQRAEIKESKK
jgi:transcriptional regulator with XRE-family HTH domain